MILRSICAFKIVFLAQSKAACFLQSRGLVILLAEQEFKKKYKFGWRKNNEEEPIFAASFKDYFGKFEGPEEASEQQRKSNINTVRGALEKNVQSWVVKRLCGCFGLESSTFVRSQDGFIFDCLLRSQGTPVSEPPAVLVEFKRSLQTIDRDIDQLTAYVVSQVVLYPQMSVLKILLTDGWSFFIGTVYRKSHAHFETSFVEQKYQLYR